jgi:hypothetical protein
MAKSYPSTEYAPTARTIKPDSSPRSIRSSQQWTRESRPSGLGNSANKDRPEAVSREGVCAGNISIQELAYGSLKKETVERLRVLGKQYDCKAGERPKGRGQRLPIAGTRLIREWRGIEHAVTVRGDDFEYQGRPYKSLSAIAREITGVRWNGWVFFGLRNHRGAA